jgi:hypothetical protein
MVLYPLSYPINGNIQEIERPEPVMFFFVLVEYIISRIQHHELYERKEAIGSTLVGLGT